MGSSCWRKSAGRFSEKMQLLAGYTDTIKRWAAQRIDGLSEPTHVFGLVDEIGALRGCLLLNEITANTAEFIVYSEAGLGPGAARQVFATAFDRYGRLQVTVERKNTHSLKQTPKWGFKYDGTARNFFGPGADAVRFVMMKQDCRWLRKTRQDHGILLQA